MLNTITNYDDRISAGKQQESFIISAMKARGFNIEIPNAHQDKYDKIDGFILPKAGGRLSFQLKQRESKNDIIFEIIKDWDQNIEGRDLISKAELYVIVDSTGLLNIYNVNEIKAKAKELLALADAKPNINQVGQGWELKFTIDKAHGNKKLMAFFSPSLFTSKFSWRIPNYHH
jgi:hypothetical protein